MLIDIQNQIEEIIRVKESLLNYNVREIEEVAQAIIDAYKDGNKVLIMGNGGSAADAQHFVAELAGRYMKEREPLPAYCLNTNVSTLTAISNDYGYDKVFERQVEALAEPGDVVIGISTSGNSKNINKALSKAIDTGCITVGLSGRDGGVMKSFCSHSINVRSQVTPRIQEAHIAIIHIICDLVEKTLF